MRRIRTNNINTEEYWNSFATSEYTEKDAQRGGNLCKFNTLLDILPENSSILDIGCLNGNFYNFLKEKKFNILSFTGIDFSTDLINLANERFPEQIWIVADRLKLPFEDNKFDVITLLEVLEHVEDPRASLREACRLCKNSGIIIISVPNELKIEDPAHIWSFTTEDVFNLLSEFSTNVQVLQTCSNNRNIIGKAIINFRGYF